MKHMQMKSDSFLKDMICNLCIIISGIATHSLTLLPVRGQSKVLLEHQGLQENNDAGLEVAELSTASIFPKDNKRNESSNERNDFSQRQRCLFCVVLAFAVLSHYSLPSQACISGQSWWRNSLACTKEQF